MGCYISYPCICINVEVILTALIWLLVWHREQVEDAEGEYEEEEKQNEEGKESVNIYFIKWLKFWCYPWSLLLWLRWQILLLYSFEAFHTSEVEKPKHSLIHSKWQLKALGCYGLLTFWLT